MWTFLKTNNFERDTYTIFIRKMKKTSYLLFILLFFIACKSENERRIVGKWQALQLLECDNVVPIQIELVGIEFMPNGKYIFHSTLNVKEEGDYWIRKNFLFTQDKTREKAPEKAVLIKSIEDDTLVLQMSFKGKDQWLTLVKDAAEKKEALKSKEEMGVPTAVATADNLTTNLSDSIQKAEELKKQESADMEVQRQKDEAAADKKREEEADRKREEAKKSDSKLSASEAYKKREAKRIVDERIAKADAERKAAIFRKEYAIREAERKKRESRKN